MISKIIIFTDLDGTLLHSETFEFENIRQYIKNLLSKNISICLLYTSDAADE